MTSVTSADQPSPSALSLASRLQTAWRDGSRMHTDFSAFSLSSDESDLVEDLVRYGLGRDVKDSHNRDRILCSLMYYEAAMGSVHLLAPGDRAQRAQEAAEASDLAPKDWARVVRELTANADLLRRLRSTVA